MAEAVAWSRLALADLQEIVDYIARDKPGAAERMKARLQSAGDSLGEFPTRGRPLGGSIRQLASVRPYVIIYQTGVSPIRILRVRHGARRPLRG